MSEDVENDLSERRYEKFDAFLSDIDPEGSKIGVLLHQNPDPDAMGAGLALQWLIEKRYGIDVDILYCGEISHPQNKTAVNVLDLRMTHVTEVDLSTYECFATVDCTPSNTGVNVEVDIVFDHHDVTCDVTFVDIRTAGSTCSILWEYLDHFEMDFTSEHGTLVATALVFGICSDTSNLFSDNVTDLDRRAHHELNGTVDRKKYRKIVDFPLPSYLVDLKLKAAQNRFDEGSVMISGLGLLSKKHQDALPIIADEYLQLEGIETVVVYGVIDNHVRVSVRSSNSSVNVPGFCEELFGKKHAGGRTGSGGATVPVGFPYSPGVDDDLRQKFWDVANEIIRRRVIKYFTGSEV